MCKRRIFVVRYYTNCLNERVPESVEEAVDILFNLLTCEFGRMVIGMDPLEFALQHHFTLGLWIRNCFKLWSKDSKIIRELGSIHPDDASAIILSCLWEKFSRECLGYEFRDESKSLNILRKMIKKDHYCYY